jgi:uncharacterized protein
MAATNWTGGIVVPEFRGSMEEDVGAVRLPAVVHLRDILAIRDDPHAAPSKQLTERISSHGFEARREIRRKAYGNALRIFGGHPFHSTIELAHQEAALESRFKIFSDPVHGFISVPKNLILELIQSPEVQRLRRIRQLGLGHLVFPGAEHTRFGHALGAMALMQDTLANISEKGTPVSVDEHTAALAAALLHDIGHGPFSHTLEHDLFSNFHHEQMSRALIQDLNLRHGGALDLALEIFDGTYDRPFFHQLISSQLDMDRLDYLRRDSFYTGVIEGQVGIERIIKTMRVHPVSGDAGSQIVAEAKGIYAVENYLISRRLMYWQVYLHKTVLAADHLLRGILRRVRARLNEGNDRLRIVASPALLFFLERSLDEQAIHDDDVRKAFISLDDTDVVQSIKAWMQSDDPILSDLSSRFVNRDFFRVTFLDRPLTDEQMLRLRDAVSATMVDPVSEVSASPESDVDFYFGISDTSHSAYERIEDSIAIIDRENNVREMSEMADMATISALTRFVRKPYVWAPKTVDVRAALAG